MSVYLPTHFTAPDRAAAARLVHDHPFATLVTPAPDGPLISHVPLLLMSSSEPNGMLLGHMARANPHWRQAGSVESVAIFHGPHAYVSPSWFADPANGVPTWNYAVVHATGTLEVLDDPLDARRVLDALATRFEATRDAPWQFAMSERQRDALVGAIVAFRMPVRLLTGKFKLSQNRTRDDQRRIADALDTEPYADATAVAAWMRRYGAATRE
ncbi:MAG: FMN-binding negative transcriptional regulator [Betaproteobacteria bacterium]